MNTKELKSTKLYKEYSLEIPYEEIDIEVDNKINQILPTVNIPGFRKGKAPLNIVKKKYEDRVIDISNLNIPTQELLLVSDILVTDYSGIYFDYLLLG